MKDKNDYRSQDAVIFRGPSGCSSSSTAARSETRRPIPAVAAVLNSHSRASVHAPHDDAGARPTAHRNRKPIMTHPEPTEIAIDGELCAASAMCQRIAPGLFSMPDDADTAVALKPQVTSPEELALAEEAVASCPTQAILLRRVEAAR